jgi:hypothetical protein
VGPGRPVDLAGLHVDAHLQRGEHPDPRDRPELESPPVRRIRCLRRGDSRCSDDLGKHQVAVPLEGRTCAACLARPPLPN